MFGPLVVLICAIICGRLLRRTTIPALAARLVLPAVILLLFILGMGLGADERLMGDLDALVARAVLLSLFAIAGCLCVARPLGRKVSRFMQRGRP